MAIVGGVNPRANIHVKANEHSGKGGPPPVIMHLPIGTVAGQEELFLADLQSRLQAMTSGKVISASLCPAFGYGALPSYNTFRPNDLPEANENRYCEVIVVDASGSVSGKITIPFVLPGLTEAQVAAFILADLGGVAGKKLQVNPIVNAPVATVAQVQFRSRM